MDRSPLPTPAPVAPAPGRMPPLAAAAPVVFVVLWSTGFVAARYATEDNGPLAFLAVRLALAGAGLALVAAVSGATWPTGSALRTSTLAGLGLHAAYLGGVFVAIDQGMSPALSALIAGLHPVVTSVLAHGWFGERLVARQWVGVALGLAGVAVFTGDRLTGTEAALPVSALAAMAVALAGMVAGTLVQRLRNAEVSLVPGTAVHYLTSAAVLAAVATAVERRPLQLTATFVLAQVWAIGVLSIGAVLLMLWLLRARAAATVSSLFFLTPALSAIEAWVLFGDALDPVTVAALALSAVGVVLVCDHRAGRSGPISVPLMDIVRVFTGPDGRSHFDDVTVELDDHGALGRISDRWPGGGVQFREVPGDYELDFHTAPRRQLVVNLTGSVQIEVGSGETRTLGPGAILLAEDTTGQGHISRNVDGQPRTCLFVHLD